MTTSAQSTENDGQDEETPNNPEHILNDTQNDEAAGGAEAMPLMGKPENDSGKRPESLPVVVSATAFEPEDADPTSPSDGITATSTLSDVAISPVNRDTEHDASNDMVDLHEDQLEIEDQVGSACTTSA